jgi:hypothetical protein
LKDGRKMKEMKTMKQNARKEGVDKSKKLEGRL